MQLNLSRNRVLLLANIAAQFSKRYEGSALANALVAISAELNQMIADHDNKSKA